MVAKRSQKNNSRGPHVSISITGGEINLSFKQIGAIVLGLSSLLGVMQKAQSKSLHDLPPTPPTIVLQAPTQAAQMPTPASVVIINCNNATQGAPARNINQGVNTRSSTKTTACISP